MVIYTTLTRRLLKDCNDSAIFEVWCWSCKDGISVIIIPRNTFTFSLGTSQGNIPSCLCIKWQFLRVKVLRSRINYLHCLCLVWYWVPEDLLLVMCPLGWLTPLQLGWSTSVFVFGCGVRIFTLSFFNIHSEMTDDGARYLSFLESWGIVLIWVDYSLQPDQLFERKSWRMLDAYISIGDACAGTFTVCLLCPR